MPTPYLLLMYSAGTHALSVQPIGKVKPLVPTFPRTPSLIPHARNLASSLKKPNLTEHTGSRQSSCAKSSVMGLWFRLRKAVILGDDVADKLGVMHYEPPLPGVPGVGGGLITGGETAKAPTVFTVKYDVDAFRKYHNSVHSRRAGVDYGKDSRLLGTLCLP